MITRSRCLLAAAAAVSGLALAGCAASSSPPAGSPSASGSAASSASSARPASTTSAASSASASAVAAAPASSPSRPVNPGGPMARATGQAVAECTSAQLKVAYTSNAQIRDGALDGMSHADSVITFTNVSSATCRTQGYPGVAALDAAGHQIMQAVRGRTATGQTPLIVLAPGQVASAEITGNTASCTTLTKVAAFLVTAPDQRTSIHLAGAHDFCLNSLGIDPLQRGDAGGLPL
jgi:Protein of unknown function (DUF4232)